MKLTLFVAAFTIAKTKQSNLDPQVKEMRGRQTGVERKREGEYHSHDSLPSNSSRYLTSPE